MEETHSQQENLNKDKQEGTSHQIVTTPEWDSHIQPHGEIRELFPNRLWDVRQDLYRNFTIEG
jgi:hypothetical protein